MDVETDDRIAKLNDHFRKTASQINYTQGVLMFGFAALTDISVDIRTYNDFNENNDPYREHDFGSFEYEGEKLFWKIDYFDQELKYGKDPLDPDCNRVLTVMLSSEY